MSCVEWLTNKAGWKLFGLLSDSSWHSAVHPPHIHIKVPPHLLFYLLLGIEITGPLIPNTHTHTMIGDTHKSLSSLHDPARFPTLALPQPFVEPMYLSEAPLQSPAGKPLLLTRRRVGGGLIFMLDVLLFAVATQKPILSPISFNWRSRLWNVCSD